MESEQEPSQSALKTNAKGIPFNWSSNFFFFFPRLTTTFNRQGVILLLKITMDYLRVLADVLTACGYFSFTVLFCEVVYLSCQFYVESLLSHSLLSKGLC